MKNQVFIKSFILLAVILLTSCNEDNWLKEVPLSIYSPENSFTEPEHFNSAVARLYRSFADVSYTSSDNMGLIMGGLADNLFHNYPLGISRSEYAKSIFPESGLVLHFWRNYYRLIFDANVIIGRIDDEEIKFASGKTRETLKAEAKFFRAFAYKNLATLFGGVPIVLEEISESKRDFLRASREEVLDQAFNDLQFSVSNLPGVTELTEDGRLTKAAANHLLTEVCLIKNDWDKAISAASEVINDPNYALITERFGVWKDKPGDVFRDLFIRNNQNRHGAGRETNTEAIWVGQYEYNVPGGGVTSFGTRFYGVRYSVLTGKEDGKRLFFGISNQNGGAAVGFYTSSDYVNYKIWEDDFNDMRNSDFNIWRDMVADNPESVYYGQKIVESGAVTDPRILQEQGWFWRPFWLKLVPYGNFPAETIANEETGEVYTSANSTYTDSYIMRLAETYLLRAEAYLGKGMVDLAAADINVVRARANATPVSPGEVDMDYILDERARELHLEELRTLTLMRVNRNVERVLKYNPYYNNKYAQLTMHDHFNLWPIPQSEIERNVENRIEQNPGYTGGN